MQDVESPLMTKEEAAAYLKLPVKTLQWFRAAHKGPAYLKPGREVFYTKRDLDSFLDQKKVIPRNN